MARRFRGLAERRATELREALTPALELIIEEALAYYAANKGKGEAEVDHSAFFRAKRRHTEFRAFWSKRRAAARFDRLWASVKDVLSTG